MIKKRSRRLTLQLTPLLDLLLIVIFAQFMDVRQEAQDISTEHSTSIEKRELQIAELEREVANSNRLLTQTELQLAVERKAYDSKNSKLASNLGQTQKSLERTRMQRESIGEVVKELFKIPVEDLSKSLQPQEKMGALTQKQVAEIKVSINRIGSERIDRIVKHLLTYDEVLKRCDIWDLYLDDQGVIHLDINKRDYEFRAESPGEFETRMFDLYKTLPETKSLVIVLIAYGDTSAGARQAIELGMPKVTKRMAENSQTLTRFEYAILGYRPEVPASR